MLCNGLGSVYKCHVTPATKSRDFIARQGSRDKVAACDFITHAATLTQRHPNRWKLCLFVARCVKVAACDYEVARCDFVARQSRATKSQV